MQKYIKVIIIGLFALVISGCSVWNVGQIKNENLVLLPITQGPSDYVYKQKITIEGRGKQRDFIAISRLNEKSLTIVVLLGSGQTIMTLKYDGEKFHQKSVSKMDIPAQDIMAIMQFALWPKNVVDQYYSVSQGWSTEFSHNKRALSGYNKPVLEVDYLTKKLSVYNARDNYKVYIRNLDQTDLEY